MTIKGKIVSFYNEKGTQKVKIYNSSTGKNYRMAVVQIPGHGNAPVRCYDESAQIRDEVEISQLVNAETGEVIKATTGETLFSCRVSTTVDNNLLSNLFGTQASTPASKVESGLPD